MTGRDRIVAVFVVVAIVLAAVWIELVSPKRSEANKLASQVSAAKAQLETAEGQVADARTAQSQYAAAYSTMVDLGKAVPPTEEVPSLIDQLTLASDEKNVYFASIAGGGTAGGSSAGAASSSSASASAAAPSAGALPFTFSFEGSYFDLERLFRRLASLTTINAAGDIEVSGRLLTIQSVTLSGGNSSSGSEAASSSELKGAVSASAYVMPAAESVTGTATSSSTTNGAAPAAASTPASSTTAPAVIKANP
jgi:Tfp pilus assembly protein PilO